MSDTAGRNQPMMPLGWDWNVERLNGIARLLDAVAGTAMNISDALRTDLRRDAAFLREFMPTVVHKRDAEIARLRAALKATTSAQQGAEASRE